jgi:hypothetical protein
MNWIGYGGLRLRLNFRITIGGNNLLNTMQDAAVHTDTSVLLPRINRIVFANFLSASKLAV